MTHLHMYLSPHVTRMEYAQIPKHVSSPHMTHLYMYPPPHITRMQYAQIHEPFAIVPLYQLHTRHCLFPEFP